MGFPKNVKEKILIETARHCCVCHRYKGVKVEVHHIKQEALGGENTYENAIVLCFDCHADAGHYNAQHPRGTKFSQSELINAKNNWLKMVKENAIQQPQETDKFLCRYYVCQHYEDLVQIIQNNLSTFPVKKPLLIRNEILDSLSKIIQKHPTSYRHAFHSGKLFSSEDEYLKLYPDTYIPDKSDGKYSYFKMIRNPLENELETIKEDGLLQLMLEENLPNDLITIICCYEEGCGDFILQEEYIFRKLWCSFLAITNITDRPIALDSLVGNKLLKNGFTSLTTTIQSTETIPLPKAAIEPNSTVLLPIALIMPPIYPLKTENWSSATSRISSAQSQIITHEGITSENIIDCLTYGSQIIANKINYQFNGNIYSQEIHEFDLTNMYTIDKYWMCGSCPHLFYVNETVSYSRELLTDCESKMGTDFFTVPENVKSIIIAEVEDEITEIISIKINGITYLENILLKKYDFIKIPSCSGKNIEIIGQYISNTITDNNILKGVKRNEIISNFLHHYKKEVI